MNDAIVSQPESTRLTAIHSVAMCLFSAVLTELVLGGALMQGFYFSHVAIGRTIVTFLSLYSVHYYALRSLNSYRPVLRDYLFVSFIILGAILTLGFGNLFANILSSYTKQFNIMGGIEPSSFLYALPFGTGGLLLQTVLGLHYGFVFAVSFGVIMGVYYTHEPVLVPYAMALTFIACLSISKLRSRSAYTRASMNLVLAALPFTLASVIMTPSLTPGEILVRILGGLVGGVLCAFIAAGLTPVVEYLGGYVTDLRLIEMATLDHPLLKELSVQAPGTWNHSMVMGMMSESAAEAIGANPVVARVGAYFHDIGKTKKPLYFVENQLTGENRHDKLSTSMSALIIRSHVKDGIELAEKYGLPKVIEDMIPQHHGTALIEYFYEKAQKESREVEGEEAEVDQSLYRYPGPKPQTREAGILMLADGIEASARTLSEPSHDRIQGLVQKMINKVFSSGQLSECELTLNDLHRIAKSFSRVLNGIYHQRIAYHEPAEKVHDKEAPQESYHPAESEAQKELEAHEETKGAAKENLKRLGL